MEILARTECVNKYGDANIQALRRTMGVSNKDESCSTVDVFNACAEHFKFGADVDFVGR